MDASLSVKSFCNKHPTLKMVTMWCMLTAIALYCCWFGITGLQQGWVETRYANIMTRHDTPIAYWFFVDGVLLAGPILGAMTLFTMLSPRARRVPRDQTTATDTAQQGDSNSNRRSKPG